MAYDVNLEPRARSAMFALQGDAATVATALGALGMALPKVANTTSHGDGLDVFWIGRARWLLRGPLDAEEELMGRLAPLREAPRVDAVCVSDYYAGFTVEGPDTRAVLAQGCPLDLHERGFPLDAASFTSLFSLRALLHYESSPSTYALYVEASVADYVQASLQAAIG